jgi:hypothetical protein
MNVVFTMTLPRSHKIRNRPDYAQKANAEDDDIAKVFPFQNIYAMMEVQSLKELLKMLHENDFIVAREFTAKTKFDGTKYIEDRGEVILNCQMIGKIKPFFE